MIFDDAEVECAVDLAFDAQGFPLSKFVRVVAAQRKYRVNFHMFSSLILPDDRLTVVTEPVANDRRRGQAKLAFDRNKSGLCNVLYEVDVPGTYRYFIEWNEKCLACAFFQLPPLISGTICPSSVRLQTVLMKWTTPAEFQEHIVPRALRVGYNMLHFMPIQERGISDSPYSITNQLEASHRDFADGQGRRLAAAARMDLVDTMLGHLKQQKMAAMIDVVWNHTACDTPWLVEHPEAGYTLETAPHLRAAFELDEAIMVFSRSLRGLGLPTAIESEADLISIMDGLEEKVLKELALWEYLAINVDDHLGKFAAAPGTQACAGCSDAEAFTVVFDGRYQRGSYHLDMDKVLSFYTTHKFDDPRADFVERLRILNMARYSEYDGLVKEIVSNMSGRIRYERLAPEGPRLGPITSHSPLVSTYFTRLAGADTTTAFANNGWIWNADPLVNFAEAPGLAYLKREIIIWGDCVKLRYGRGKDDAPWLWDHMAQYSRAMAERFPAFRIDNCHSTPIHVARWLLSEARSVRRDLWVVAELFTGRKERDELFVCELGIDALIREALVAASPGELARAVQQYSGRATEPLALFMDCTHDNPAPAQTRTAVDALPNAAIVAFALDCAIGSVRGYDELCPRHLNIVTETKKYAIHGWTALEEAKSRIYRLRPPSAGSHMQVAENDRVVVISRIDKATKEEYRLFAKTAFTEGVPASIIEIPSSAEVLLSVRLRVGGDVCEDGLRLAGLQATLEPAADPSILHPGSICLLRMPATSTPPLQIESVFADVADAEWERVLSVLTLVNLNTILYRTDAEGRDHDSTCLSNQLGPCGVYVVPGHGPLAYCGIAGFYLGWLGRKRTDPCFGDDPFSRNAREGPWMLDYTVDRLAADRQVPPEFPSFLAARFASIKARHFLDRPKLVFDAFQVLHARLCGRAARLLGFEGQADGLEARLALGVVQMYGAVASTSLHPTVQRPCLAAGLPHFATHHMRCWGRDTFVAYRGLFLLSGLLDEGRQLLGAFGGCLYKGLIPNLLDAGRRPRFNARDAVWWFVYAAIQHARLDPTVLDMAVPLRFPDGEYVEYDEQVCYRTARPLRDILVAVFAAHVEGIDFVEFGAGPRLDEHMDGRGFRVQAGVDLATGIVYGGSEHNCGTWMDKMGSCEGVNKGVPSTPRNGAAVEINALCLWSLTNFLGVSPDSPLPRGYSVSRWARCLADHFDRLFYNPATRHYRDCLGSDQLRPNYLIAIALLPDLLDRQHCMDALAQARQLLAGPIGMRSLSPAHPLYDPFYRLDDRSANPNTASGANYHNGPEWTWLTGFYLIALRRLGVEGGAAEMVGRVTAHLLENAFGGVVELTDKDGLANPHSCTSQAWSMGCLREAMHECT